MKAEEILSKLIQEEGYEDIRDWLVNASTYNQEEIILAAMKEYALACLEKAADNATT